MDQQIGTLLLAIAGLMFGMLVVQAYREWRKEKKMWSARDRFN